MQNDLVVQAQRGDAEAFSTLTLPMTSRLYAVACLILRDHDRADDAVQDALLRAWQDLRALRDPDRFEAWMHRVLVRTCYAAAKRNRARRLMEIDLPDTISGPRTQDTQAAVERRDELDRGFAQLSTEHRAVLVLVYFVGLSLTETADTLGVPLGTVQSRLNRAMTTMRGLLDADARIAHVATEAAR